MLATLSFFNRIFKSTYLAQIGNRIWSFNKKTFKIISVIIQFEYLKLFPSQFLCCFLSSLSMTSSTNNCNWSNNVFDERCNYCTLPKPSLMFISCIFISFSLAPLLTTANAESQGGIKSQLSKSNRWLKFIKKNIFRLLFPRVPVAIVFNDIARATRKFHDFLGAVKI